MGSWETEETSLTRQRFFSNWETAETKVEQPKAIGYCCRNESALGFYPLIRIPTSSQVVTVSLAVVEWILDMVTLGETTNTPMPDDSDGTLTGVPQVSPSLYPVARCSLP